MALATAGLTLALVAWDVARLDMPLARWWGDAQGFALRDSWLLADVLHDGARRLAWALTLALCLGVWWPVGWLRAISTARRLQLAGTTLAAALAVSTLKSFSGTSCPWDMAEFGGVARYASQGLQHWLALTQGDGGSGRCFPAGHASAGFCVCGRVLCVPRHAPGTGARLAGRRPGRRAGAGPGPAGARARTS
jgi:membrane-associated PAP2 superfamily phosphatase